MAEPDVMVSAPARPTAETGAPLVHVGGPARRRGDGWLYVAAAAVTALLLIPALQLWRARLTIPLSYRGDALAVGAHFKTVIEQGWYEFNPALGAPAGQTYHDYATADNLQFIAAWLLARGSDQFAVAVNLYYLLGFPLAAIAAAWFLRLAGVSGLFALPLSVLYAFAPYHFWRGESHLSLASYYPVPLALGLSLLVVRGEALWAFRPRSGVRGRRWLRPLTRRNLATVVILLLIGTASTYYSLFTLFFLAVGSLFSLTRKSSFAAVRSAIAAGGFLVAVMLANMAPDLLYERSRGANLGALSRSAEATEFYAAKLSSLLLPAPTHRLELFRELRQDYDGRWPLPSESSALGLVAATGLLFLLALAVVVLVRAASRTDSSSAKTEFPDQRWQTLRQLSVLTCCGLVLVTVGGVSTFFALFVSDSIRGWNRISIFLALMALAAIGLLLDAGLDRLRCRRFRLMTPRGSRAIVGSVAAFLLLVVGFADQTSSQALDDYEQQEDAFRSDAEYVVGIERKLPAQSMVFQLPFRPFPETPPVFGVSDYEELKPYLHSSYLRWSYGGIKGRPQADWPADIVTQPTNVMVDSLALAGFAGLHVDRNGFADAGAALERELASTLVTQPWVSLDQRYSFWDLRQHGQHVQDQLSPDRAQQLRRALLEPVRSYLDSSFDLLRQQDGSWITYAAPPAIVYVDNPRDAPVEVELSLSVRAAERRLLLLQSNGALGVDPYLTRLHVEWPDRRQENVELVAPLTTLEHRLRVPPGRSELHLSLPSGEDAWLGVAAVRVVDPDVQQWQAERASETD